VSGTPIRSSGRGGGGRGSLRSTIHIGQRSAQTSAYIASRSKPRAQPYNNNNRASVLIRRGVYIYCYRRRTISNSYNHLTRRRRRRPLYKSPYPSHTYIRIILLCLYRVIHQVFINFVIFKYIYLKTIFSSSYDIFVKYLRNHIHQVGINFCSSNENTPFLV